MASLVRQELLRARWRRELERRGLNDELAADFALRLPAITLEGLTARFVAIPADPEGSVLPLDDEFQARWMALKTPPLIEPDYVWGRSCIPGVDSLIRSDREDGRHTKYLAILRSGAMEWAVTYHGRREWRASESHPDRSDPYVFLVALVGRIWSSMLLHDGIVSGGDLDGPWLFALAVRETLGARLASFGYGWAEPSRQFERDPVCDRANLLLVTESEKWPTEGALKEIALSFGTRLESAFHSKLRRYLNREGDEANQFALHTFISSCR